MSRHGEHTADTGVHNNHSNDHQKRKEQKNVTHLHERCTQVWNVASQPGLLTHV